jgi:hypothetical protein
MKILHGVKSYICYVFVSCVVIFPILLIWHVINDITKLEKAAAVQFTLCVEQRVKVSMSAKEEIDVIKLCNLKARR